MHLDITNYHQKMKGCEKKTTVPTDIWTKRIKLSVSQYRLPLWARAEWRGASTKLTSQIMSEARDFTEI